MRYQVIQQVLQTFAIYVFVTLTALNSQHFVYQLELSNAQSDMNSIHGHFKQTLHCQVWMKTRVAHLLLLPMSMYPDSKRVDRVDVRPCFLIEIFRSLIYLYQRKKWIICTTFGFIGSYSLNKGPFKKMSIISVISIKNWIWQIYENSQLTKQKI